MRAVLIPEPGRIEVATVPDPEPKPDEIVIAVAGCGICGTDLHILAGEVGNLPLTPGHEFAGTIVATGSKATRFRVGDSVGTDPNIYCGECRQCRRGRNNLCEHYNAIGVTLPGAAAEYVAVPEANCVLLPPEIDTAIAALIEPLSCAVRGFDVLQLMLGDHLLIYGAGTMGLMNLQLAKRAGAASVSVIDLNTDRLNTATTLGCTATAVTSQQLDRPEGWDAVIDCTGNIAAIEDGITQVARGGTFLQFGVSTPHATANIEPYRIYRDEIRIVGSMAVLHSYERAAGLFLDGVIDPAVFISHRLPLEDYGQGIEQLRTGVGRKTLIV